MIFKIVFENEIYRLRKSVASFQELQEVIQTRFGEQLYKFYCVEYVDVDGDKVRINCQEDYEILLEEMENSKTVKIFIKEDLNQSTQITVAKSEASVEVLSETEEPVLVAEPEVVAEPEPVITEPAPVEEPKTEETAPTEEMTTEKTESSDNNEDNSNTEAKFDESCLKCELWAPYFDNAANEDNPLMILWKLKKLVQQKIQSLKAALNAEHKGFFKKSDWKLVRDECRRVARKSFNDEIPTAINYDDIKSHLFALEGTDNLQAWIIFRITVQHKINKTRQFIKSVPELHERLRAFHQAKKEGKGCHKGWRKWKGCKGDWWGKKKEFFKRKFEQKLEQSMEAMLPRIAQEVAKILKNDPAPVEVPVVEEKPVHKGYVCDGCGVCPIVGVCYKSSVVPDFDFCEVCEATKPHPHPFLKLKTPEQRPIAIFTVLNEEGQEPFKMDSNKQADKVLGMMIQECKKQKQCFAKVEKMKKKEAEKRAKKEAFEALKAARQEAKKAEKLAKQQAKKALKLAKQEAKKAEKLAKKEAKKALKLAKKEAKKAEKLAKKANKQHGIVDNLMAIFQVCEEKRGDLFNWVAKTKMMDVNKLANKFLSENLLAKFGMKTVETPSETVETETTTAGFEDVHTPQPEPVVVVKEVDQVALANANQLMEIFSVASEKKDTVYDWVVAKNETQIETLVNAFLEEMLGKF